MKRLYYAIASLALLLAGCTEDDTFRQYEQVSSFSEITVTADDLANTRVYINDNRKAVWEQGDTIGVYSDIEGVVPFVYSSGNTFKAAKAVKGNQFYAFYPYSGLGKTYVDEANKLHVYVSGNDKFPMAGKSTNSQFVFKHTMGIVHFAVKNIAKLSSVTLIPNNDVTLMGQATIDMTAENPILIMDEQSISPNWTPWNTAASIFFKDLELKDGEAVDIYLPVPVGTYSKGFNVEISGEKDNSEYVQIFKNTDKSLTVERASMNNYTELDLYGELAAEQAKERAALIAIYNALDGDNWENNENWCTDKPLNEWYGVWIENGHVISIDDALNYNNVHGDIPAELGDLTHLQRLQLYSAQGITSLPKEIGKLDRVWAMSIYGSSITSLPDEMGNMRLLNTLNLSDMPIKTLPKELANCLNLSAIYISGTELETLPAEFANFVKLGALTLSNNQLTTLPEGVTNNKSISSLSIYEEGIQQLPATIGNMSNLQSLTIGCNNLTSLPAELGNLSNLTSLSIHHTRLNGNLPAELGNLKNLQMLDLSYNEFTGTIPASYGDLSNLATLNITENNMSGEISKTILNSSMWAHLNNAYINPQHNEEGLTFEGGEVAVSKITLDRTSVTTSREGAPITFNRDDRSIKVTLEPAYATNKNLYVEIPDHEYHAESIVRLYYDDYGFYLAAGGKAGIETVTVRVEGSNAFAELEVTNKGIAFNKNRVRMKKGDTFTNQFTQYGDEPIISWYTSDTNIVQVDSNGKVNAIKEGNAWVYATVQYVGTFSYEVNVIGKEVSSGDPEEFNRDTDGEWD